MLFRDNLKEIRTEEESIDEEEAALKKKVSRLSELNEKTFEDLPDYAIETEIAGTDVYIVYLEIKNPSDSDSCESCFQYQRPPELTLPA